MPRVAPRVPEMTDLLCERCGYVLNGLPPDGRCPECGQSIDESVGHQRTGPAWEASDAAGGFFRTTAAVLLQPARFYRTLTVRGSVASARRFAMVHWWIAAALFSVAGCTHGRWYFSEFVLGPSRRMSSHEIAIFIAAIVAVAVLVYLSLDAITRLAARLTNWEATYRGLRLPYDVVLRGLYFHAAHYVPVAAAAAGVIVGYQVLLRSGRVSLYTSLNPYLYTLCGLVIVSAAYLFQTYWIGMRNMMYANR